MKHVAVFLLIPTVTYLPFGLVFTDVIMERVQGPSMKQQVLASFGNAKQRDYDLLIIGNSRMYRGLNPDKFSLTTFNFSHDNDTYNQIYHKFKWLDRQGKSFKYVLLGVDYFQFSFINDRRNHVYCDLFDETYSSDYPPYPWYSKKRWFAPGAIRGMNPQYLFSATDGRAQQKDNGQYIVPGKATPEDTVTRSSQRLDIQVSYFEMILDHCERKGVKVFLCMLPIRAEEAAAYDDEEITEFHSFLSAYVDNRNRVLIDHTFNPNYVMEDFADITHLTPSSGDRYSAELSEVVSAWLNGNSGSAELQFADRRSTTDRRQ